MLRLTDLTVFQAKSVRQDKHSAFRTSLQALISGCRFQAGLSPRHLSMVESPSRHHDYLLVSSRLWVIRTRCAESAPAWDLSTVVKV